MVSIFCFHIRQSYRGPASHISSDEMVADLYTFSAAQNQQTGEGVAVKKVTNVFSKKILAKRALREIKLLQHFRGHRNVHLPIQTDHRRYGTNYVR